MWQEDAIRDAIASKTVLSLVYNDEERQLEPHIFGRNAEGELILNGWQISGRPGWRNLLLAKVGDLRLTDEHFWHARPGYSSDDATFAEVIWQL